MKPGIHLIRLIVFLSSFLLFQIELIIGKIFLPNFGGSFMVWGACMVFFQAILCAGYKYSEVVLRRFGILRYRFWHLILLAVPLISFPGRELALRYIPHDIPVVFDIFWQLCVTIGLVFFVLSTMSIIWQVWLGDSELEERKDPYTLFAVSNFGSFAALLTYPFAFEPFMDLSMQQTIWRCLYAVLILLQLIALKVIPMAPAAAKEEKDDAGEEISVFRKLQWVLYSAGGVIMFMASTNILTMEIAPVPLLWVIPLALYLLAFVLAFKKEMWGSSWLDRNIHLVMAAGSVYFLFLTARKLILGLDILVMFAITFAICLHAQRQLRLLKPEDHRGLPQFYFLISVGGFAGGALVSWGIPLVFDYLAEYFIAFIVICYARGQTTRQLQKFKIVLFCIVATLMFYFYPLVFPWVTVLMILGLLLWGVILFQTLSFQRYGVVIILFVMMSMMTFFEESWTKREILHKSRNYYGVHTVFHLDGTRKYMHGTTVHGLQPLDPENALMPTTYYGLDSPLGGLIRSKSFDFKDIAMLGLGVGTVTTYIKPEQTVDIYELDPFVVETAEKYFTYLKNAQGKVNMLIGDARIEMEKHDTRTYDLIIVDVFTGDAVPEHLMTLEAMELYHARLKPGGILLIHASNRHLLLGRALYGTATAAGAKVVYLETDSQMMYTSRSSWVAISWDEAVTDKLADELGWYKPTPEADARAVLWTDKYTSISRIINKGNFKRFFFDWRIPWY